MGNASHDRTQIRPDNLSPRHGTPISPSLRHAWNREILRPGRAGFGMRAEGMFPRVQIYKDELS
jgi:hypothetical protein